MSRSNGRPNSPEAGMARLITTARVLATSSVLVLTACDSHKVASWEDSHKTRPPLPALQPAPQPAGLQVPQAADPTQAGPQSAPPYQITVTVFPRASLNQGIAIESFTVAVGGTEASARCD